MSYQEKLEDQIAFAKKKMYGASGKGRPDEVHTWNGYIQGLRYALAELTHEPAQNQTQASESECTCDPAMTMPFGECVCQPKVAPV